MTVRTPPCYARHMRKVAAIKAAIEELTTAEVEELACWLETRREWSVDPLAVDAWLERARGAAVAGVTTESVMDLTRCE